MTSATTATDLALIRLGFGTDTVPYEVGWDQQRAVHAQVADGLAPDTVLLLEHPPVYTAGRRTQPEDRPSDGTPVVDVDRGGRITWHGPGQLVGYPIVQLPDAFNVVAHVRRLEDVLIRTCSDLGFTTSRIAGRSGVWFVADEYAGERKVAAIGVRVSRGVTMHGFALNCDCDLGWFDRIVPCGIADAGVTSLTREARRRDANAVAITVADVLPLVEGHLREVFAQTPTPRLTS